MIEAEVDLRSAMASTLATRHDVEVAEAATVEAALVELDRGGVALMVCDVELGPRTGLELIGERNRRGLSTPIIFLTAPGRRDEVPPRAGADVLEKPFCQRTLRALVGRRLRPAAPFGVADYMQLAARGHHSVVIEVDVLEGAVCLREGVPWSATDADGDGPRALQRLLHAAAAEVSCRPATAFGSRSLHGSVEAVLFSVAGLEP